MNKTIILAGGSGFIGEYVAQYLVDRDYTVVILTRHPKENKENIGYVKWDGKTLGSWVEKLEGAYAIVNFTGKSVNCIYTKKNKKEIIDSRVNSVGIIDEAVKNLSEPPKAIIQAGSLAIYGNTQELCDENGEHGTGFSVEVCEKWEDAFFKEEIKNVRKVMFRIGFVLGKNGGALEPLAKLVTYNLGGTIGSGKQYISWLHINDLNKMFLEAIENEGYHGIYNATGDSPVTNRVFMATLRKTMKKKVGLPAASPLVWLGAYLVMRADPNLALGGRKCISKRLKEANFEFDHTDLLATLENVLIE